MHSRRAVLLYGSRAAKPRLRLALEPVANRYRRLLGDRLVESSLGETVSFSRASAATDAAAGVVTSYPADMPRNGQTPVNLTPNSRALGTTPGVVGSGGVAPTGWLGFSGQAGLSCEIQGVVVEAGVPLLQVRFFGTATSNNFRLYFDSPAALQLGDIYSGSVHVRLVSGTVDSWSLRMDMPDESGTNFLPNATLTRIARANRTAATTAGRPVIRVGQVVGNAYDYVVLIGGPQFERGPVVTSLALTPAETPQIGYRDAVPAPGILVEGQSTNLLANNLTTGFGNGGAHTSAVSTDLSPVVPGATIWKLTRTAATDSNMSNTATVAAAVSTLLVISALVFVPTDSTATSVTIGADNASANGASGPYDLTKRGTWQRIWRAYTTSATITGSGGQLRASGLTTGQFIYATLLQFDAGTALTSLITTSGSAASRAADLLTLSGDAFTGVFGKGAPNGFVVADVLMDTLLTNSSGRVIANLDDGTAANRLMLRTNSGGGGLISIPNLGGPQGAPVVNANAPTYGVVMRVGLRWSNGAHGSCMNGGAVSIGTSAPVDGFTVLRIGNDIGGGSPLNGRILGAWAGGIAPTDATFQAMCAANADIDAILRSAA